MLFFLFHRYKAESRLQRGKRHCHYGEYIQSIENSQIKECCDSERCDWVWQDICVKGNQKSLPRIKQGDSMGGIREYARGNLQQKTNNPSL